MARQVSNFHVEYINVTTQHWDPQSSTFAGGDQLVTAIQRGWQVEKCIEETHWFTGMRSVRVYHFTLIRDDEQIEMPVIANPYVERFVQQEEFDISDKRDVHAA